MKLGLKYNIGILVALCASQTLGFNYNYLLQDQNHAPEISDVSAAVSAERGSRDQLVLPLRSYSMIRPGLARLYPLRGVLQDVPARGGAAARGQEGRLHPRPTGA